MVVAPERAVVLPELTARYVNAKTGVSYLQGPDKNRVGANRLRGEGSQGVILPIGGLEKAGGGRRRSAPLGRPGASGVRPQVSAHALRHHRARR